MDKTDMTNMTIDGQVNHEGRVDSSPADAAFDAFLLDLDSAEQQKRDQKIAELEKNYADWADHFNLLKGHFQDLWDLCGKIENNVHGWYRAEASYGQWDFMGACGYGYNFGAGITYLGNSSSGLRPSLNFDFRPGSRHISVRVAPDCTGIGDERYLGLNIKKLGPDLVGLQAFANMSLDHRLYGSKRMLEALNKQDIKIDVYDSRIGHQKGSVEMAYLYSGDLVEPFQQMFMHMNRGDVCDPKQYLPTKG